MKIFLIILTCLNFLSCSRLQTTEEQPFISISETNPNKETAVTKQNLLHLLKVYDLRPYLFSNNVLITNKRITNSSSTVNITTKYSAHPLLILSEFLHEEFHWWVNTHPIETTSAIKDLKKHIKEKKDDDLRHLLISYLEYKALSKLLNKKEAQVIIMFRSKKEKSIRWQYTLAVNKTTLFDKIAKKNKLPI